MMWWRHKKSESDVVDMTAADEAVHEAQASTERVAHLTQSVTAGLRRLEEHRRDNHVLDAMMNTLGRARR